jgi:hypothetical protein
MPAGQNLGYWGSAFVKLIKLNEWLIKFITHRTLLVKMVNIINLIQLNQPNQLITDSETSWRLFFVRFH